VCEDYPGNQVSKDNFVAIQKAGGRLVDKITVEGFIPGLVDSDWAKGAAIMVCQIQETCDWVTGPVPKLRAWECSRLKVEGLETLPTFKRVAV
jgi:hypothetical protein